ncbi:MAG: hypothetical protein JNM31_10815 [Flavobacteriales bacterium]|nr:hypothetical protein [Flavobacteriales bacterium]
MLLVALAPGRTLAQAPERLVLKDQVLTYHPPQGMLVVTDDLETPQWRMQVQPFGPHVNVDHDSTEAFVVLECLAPSGRCITFEHYDQAMRSRSATGRLTFNDVMEADLAAGWLLGLMNIHGRLALREREPEVPTERRP